MLLKQNQAKTMMKTRGAWATHVFGLIPILTFTALFAHAAEPDLEERIRALEQQVTTLEHEQTS